MNYRMSIVIAAVGFALLSGEARSGTPTTTGLDEISIPEGITVYRDSEEPNQLWVLPPLQGVLRVNQKTPSVSVDECEVASSYYAILRTQRDRLANLQQRRDAYFDDMLSLPERGLSPEELAEQQKLLQGRLDLLATEIDRLAGQQLSIPEDLYQTAGRYSYVADSGFDSAVLAVKEQNPSYVVSPIMTEGGRMAVNWEVPNGSSSIVSISRASADAVNSVAGDVQIDVFTTKYGSCMLFYPEIMNAAGDVAAFGVAMTYTHPVASNATVRATFTFRDVYELLKQTEQSSSLFEAKSYRSLLEQGDIESALNMDISFGQDISADLRAAALSYIQEFLLSDAVRRMSEELSGELAAGQTGAGIVSEELSKVCGVNPYCMATAAGFAIADGLLGSQSTSDEINRIMDEERKLDLGMTEAIDATGSITYVAQ